MMRSQISLAVSAITVALTITSAAIQAQQNDGHRDAVAPQSAGVPNYYPANVQAAALVGQGGAPVTAIGFSSITHPAVGITCLQLAYAHPITVAPIVTVEWGRSLGVALYAQWNDASGSCPGATGKTIEVRTYKGDTGGVGSPLQVPVLSDSVAFQVIVP